MQSIVLPDSLDISYAAELHALLRDGLEAGEGVELQAAGVSRLDTAGVQLVAAFLHEARARSLPVQLVEPSDVLVSAAERLGLADLIPAATGTF